jgi:phosphoglycerate dehydrogenase-like enzyme
MARLKAAAAPHRLVTASAQQASNLVGADRDPALAEADIALGQPNPDQVLEIPRIKWVHLTTAGYTRYDTDRFKTGLRSRGGALTNSSGVYDEPCAEHILSMMMSRARHLPDALRDQDGSRAWPYLPIRARSQLLLGQTAILYGYGAIARRLVELLTPFRMNLIGVRRNPRGDEGIRIVRENDADAVLPTADHVINILPASAATEHFFDAKRLARFKPSAIYYSVGRGSTTDQNALREALESKKLAAAYLDVTTPEPLAPERSAVECSELLHHPPHRRRAYDGVRSPCRALPEQPEAIRSRRTAHRSRGLILPVAWASRASEFDQITGRSSGGTPKPLRKTKLTPRCLRSRGRARRSAGDRCRCCGR